MSDQILKDPEQGQALAENGYVVVPFLSQEEVRSLSEIFYSFHQFLPEGMYATAHAPDFDLRKKMNDLIRDHSHRALAATFAEATPLGATFMAKSKGSNGALNPHQDWTIVEESKYNSYNIWIPLVDVDEENGTILILPDSHRLTDNIRGLNIRSAFDEINDQLWPYLKPINMKAGEALIYDHRMLHASALNHTDIPRLVVVYGIIPAAAEMRYYYGNGDSIEEYACTPDFFFSQKITEGPAGLKLLRTISNDIRQISIREITGGEPAKPLNIWEKIRKLWS